MHISHNQATVGQVWISRGYLPCFSKTAMISNIGKSRKKKKSKETKTPRELPATEQC